MLTVQDVLPYAIGVATPVGIYLGYRGATKGLPAVKAKLASWWTKGKTDLAGVKGDLAALQQSVEARLSKLEAAVLPKPAAAATAAAPIAPAAAAPAAAPAAVLQA